MFSQVSVCPQGRGGLHPPCQADTPCQEDTPPCQADTPPCQADTPARQTPPCQAGPPPLEMATAADGTHPTGIHAFLFFCTDDNWKIVSEYKI